MKVGVLTFHRASNYGTALQAFATMEALKSLGFDAELIDYRPECTERTLRPRHLRKAKSMKEAASILINRVIYGNQHNEKIRRFLEFIDKMPCGAEVCYTPEKVASVAQDYDVIISGSDQLWNLWVTEGDLTYVFPFAHPKKLSYGSSFGERTISRERQELMAPWLREFTYLGLREKTALQLTQQILGPEYDDRLFRVVDPTLLLDADTWKKQMAPNVKLPQGGYILTYYMLESPLIRTLSEKLQKDTGLPVVNLKPTKRQALYRQGTNMMWAGPREFLSCYAGAKYVVTNSFHGTAFAINFEVPMYVTPVPVSTAGELSARMIDVLDWYGLSERWIESEEDFGKIDLLASVEHLQQTNPMRREESLKILKSMLYQ